MGDNGSRESADHIEDISSEQNRSSNYNNMNNTASADNNVQKGDGDDVDYGCDGGKDKLQKYEVIEEQDLPSEITFEKRSVPKSRTQSVQSVLSSVSLKSFVQQHQQQQNNSKQNKATVAPQNSQSKHINTSSYIQAPATLASSKRRASFEIGQKIPFNQDSSTSEAVVESDGETEAQDEQKKLTDDALRRLSSFSKFQPAEVDFKKLATINNASTTTPSATTTANDGETTKTVPKASSEIGMTSSKSINTRHPSSSSLSRKPQFNPSSASLQREEFPKSIAMRNTSFSTPENHPYHQNQHQYQHQYQHTHQNNRRISSTNVNNTIHSTPTPSTPSSSATITPNAVTPMNRSHSSSASTISKFDDTSSLRTINDPKRPMYVPAVLRQSNTNLKPEDLRFINEQKNQNKIKNHNKNILNNAANSIKQQNWMNGHNHHNNHSDDQYGSTDPKSPKEPTRSHWRKDLSRSSCVLCSKPFTFFERRHHCRRCGDIFCNEHVSNYLNLGEDANFILDSPNGVLCKVCDFCFKDYETFLKKKFGSNSVETNVNNSGKKNISVKDTKKKNTVDQNNSVASSIPADWSWSSF